MARSNSQRRHVSWLDYHPEVGKLDAVKGRPAKASDTATSLRRSMNEMNFTQSKVVPSQFESPDSSTVHSAEYDLDTRNLSVMLKRARGAFVRYDYPGVPPELWAEFVAAESKGSFFNARIRSAYEGVKVDRK